MPISDQIKALTEDIEASSEARSAAVAENARETRQALGNFNQEREKMASDQKRSLASNRSERTRHVQKTLADFGKERQATAKSLRAHLTGETSARVAATRDMMTHFATEREEMVAALRGALSTFQRNLSAAVEDILTEFATDQRQAHAHWAHLRQAQAARRAGKRAPAPEAESPTAGRGKKERKHR